MPDAAIACTLSAAEMGKRGRAWTELTSRWGRGSSRLSDAIVLTFAREPDAIARLELLVDQERECCAWIDFEIAESTQTVDLVMRATPEGLPIVAEMFGAGPHAKRGWLTRYGKKRRR
jgi:hypothetical protein